MDKVVPRNCAVFYIDLLGFSNLTTEKDIDIINDDCYNEWLNSYKEKGINKQIENTPHFLAAAILAKFREKLLKTKIQYDEVNVSQLSDGAFIWSTDSEDIVSFAKSFMKVALEEGILCRGGLSFGKIIMIENDDSPLGRFIVGEAATKAVKNENKGKGAIVLADSEIMEKSESHFCKIEGEELYWLDYNASWDNISSCKKFDWNRAKEGQEHVDATIRFLKDKEVELK